MGLDVKTDYKGNKIDAYLKVVGVTVSNGLSAGASTGMGFSAKDEHGNPVNINAEDIDKFWSTINYTIEFTNDEGQTQYTKGGLVTPFKLEDSSENSIKTGYELLKKDPRFSDSIDS